jgi:hypothetical protein
MATSRGAGKSLVRASLAIHEPPVGGSTTPGGSHQDVRLRLQPGATDADPPRPVEDDPRTDRTGRFPPGVHGFGAAGDDGGDLPRLLRRADQQLGAEEGRVPARLLRVTTKSIAAKQPSPPWVVFQWGSFSTARFTAYVSPPSRPPTRSSGRPVCPSGPPAGSTLHEIPSNTKGQNPTSGALTAQRVHRVVAGDSLQSLAWREYGDSAAWRAIAEANGIDDPTGSRTVSNSCCPPPRRCVPDGEVRVLQRRRGEDRRPNRSLPSTPVTSSTATSTRASACPPRSGSPSGTRTG